MLVNLGQALALAGRAGDGEPYLTRAQRIIDAHPEMTASKKIDLQWSRALVLESLGRYPEAAELARAALPESEATQGKEHPQTARLHETLAEALYGLKQYPAALDHYDRFLAVEEKLGATGDTDYARGLAKSASVLLAMGRTHDALERLERAVRLLDSPKVYPKATADAKLALADALWKAGEDHPRARALALDAQAAYAKLSRKDDAARAEKWLQAHPR
jgi:hypothetical protein